ncbi:MAG: DUF2325 domain-containing protein [Clostridia bacterium]|nr:DUF2325 domain-containing protein [Clostridia bacterium]
MSVVIVGGNECMSRRYQELCEAYDCKARVYQKMERNMKNLGSPDLLILFTGTMSHKMLRSVLSEMKGRDVPVEYCRSGSMSALKKIMDVHAKGAALSV